jgi:hypothetical protein
LNRKKSSLNKALEMVDETIHPRFFTHFQTLIVQRPRSLQVRKGDLGVVTCSTLAVDILWRVAADEESCIRVIQVND